LPPPTLTIAAGRQHTAESILRAWWQGKSAHTIASYRHDLENFAMFFSRALGMTPPMRIEPALTRLFKQSASSAHEIALAFRDHLASVQMAPSTINRHLATLRSVTKLGRMLGLMTWHLEVPGVKSERRRDVRGPTLDEVRRVLATTAGDTEAATRDAAIILTFFCLGLRVSELCALTWGETDLDRGTTWITGKGRREKELVPIPPVLATAWRRYLTHRGTRPGPLFQTLGAARGPAANGGLETRSVLRIVRTLGQRAGLHLWCHGLRHTSITQAAVLGQRAGLGLDKIRAHSRHRSIATLLLYVDEHDRRETQVQLATLVSEAL
jgi:integrase